MFEWSRRGHVERVTNRLVVTCGIRTPICLLRVVSQVLPDVVYYLASILRSSYFR